MCFSCITHTSLLTFGQNTSSTLLLSYFSSIYIVIISFKEKCLSVPGCHALLRIKCSQHINTDRSFSRLPTHPYGQWWNVTFITIKTSDFLWFCLSAINAVCFENSECAQWFFQLYGVAD